MKRGQNSGDRVKYCTGDNKMWDLRRGQPLKTI